MELKAPGATICADDRFDGGSQSKARGRSFFASTRSVAYSYPRMMFAE